ncbi:conserved hypothetical protein [Tenacibaculum sediminilitoris]|uniref:DUF2194 domain-containing protein n=1 Tax=Tenacibaculum sediminilitoris TaxID=1820334 RepID=UPI0038947F7F
MKKINKFLKIGFAALLFFFSIYGFLPQNKNHESFEKKNKNTFSKSTYFLNNSSPVVIYLGKDVSSKNKVKENIQQLCDYTKIPFATVATKKLNYEEYIFPSTLKTIFLHNTEDLSEAGIHKILLFIAKGGSLIITKAITDDRFNFLVGLKKEKSKHRYNVTAKGIKFQHNFTPSLNNRSIYTSFIHYGHDKKSFNNGIEVLLSADNEPDYPVTIKRNLELGNVYYFNTSFQITKDARGLLFPVLLSTLEGIPYPIANINTIFLDDFPSPVFPFKKEPILSEYNITSDAFVKNIWWKDMQTLANKYDIKYTTTIIFDYGENSEPPFSYQQWNLSTENFAPIPKIITLDVLKQKHELGFHGYNHISLLKEHWKEENMNVAFKTVKNMWLINNFGSFPVSYIPPSNYIDQLGVLTLHKEMPSLKYMCSLYTGEFENGGGREFNPEPYTHEMFDFPRNTSGFHLNSFNKYLKETMYLYTGIWSHFVHPDDVYQIPNKNNLEAKGEFNYRNGLQLFWKKNNKKDLSGMYYSFENIIKEHKQNYPFAKFLDVQNGAKIVANIRSSDFKHYKGSSFYYVTNNNSYHNEQNWFTYINQKNATILFDFLSKEKTPYTKIPLFNGYLVNIKTKKSKIKVPILTINQKTFSTTEILITYHNFLNFKETHESILLNKLSLLREDLFKNNNFSLETWKEYATYCSWMKLEKKFWKDLERFYFLNQNYESASLAKKMAKVIWYPTKESQRIWLERQIQTVTNSTQKLQLLKEYLKNYNSEHNIKEVRKKLLDIIKIAPTPENKVAFVNTYLWRNDPEKFAVLNTIPTIKDYKTIAKELTWFFYENKQIDKALSWARLSKKIPIETQLYWLFETGDHEKLYQYYKNYEYSNIEEEFTAKKTMIDLYLAKDRFLKAWKLAETIPETHSEYKSIQKKLNTFFLYQKKTIQKNIINTSSRFLFKKIKDSIQRIKMLEQHSYFTAKSMINTNKNDVATFDKIFTYGHISNEKHVHNFSFTNSFVGNAVNENKGSVNLYGVNYEFINSNSFDQKLKYSGKIGFEVANNNYFYSLGIKGRYIQGNNLISLSYETTPVKNNNAFQRYLYKNTFGCYFEKNFKNKLNTTAYIENNYYTDDNTDFTLSISGNYPLFKYNSNIFRTSLEGSYSVGTENVNGIPYWMTKNRQFIGSGIQYQLNTDIDKTYVLLDGMFFYDSYSRYFLRFRAKVNFQLQKHLIINFNGELFQQNLYYANSLNLGVSYYLE